MNSVPPREFARLTQRPDDFRPPYDATLFNMLRTLWRRKLLIGTVMATGVAGALGATSLMPKSYVGEALIQLSFEGEGVAASGSTGGTSAAVDPAAIVEGEAEIIRSRAIARRVASSLWAADDPTQDPTGPRLSATQHAEDTALSSGKAQSYMSVLAADLRARFATPPVPALDREVLELQSRLGVRNDAKSYLIRIAYTAADPAQAAKVANAFAETYLQSRVEVSVGSARRTSEWLASQVAAAKETLAEAEQKVSVLRLTSTGRGAADIGNSQTMDKQLADLVGQLSGVRLDRLNLEARLLRLRGAVTAGLTPSALDLAGSTDAPRLIEAEVTSRQEAARLGSTLGEKNPLVARANNAQREAREQLASAVTSAIGITEAEVASARTSEASLARQLEETKRAALESQAARQRLSQLEAEAETAHGGLVRLQESYRQALALADLKPIGAKLVSPAESLNVPASPKVSLIAILSGIISLGAGIGLVLLLELRDTGFCTAPQLAANLGARCIATVPVINFRIGAASRHFREEALKSLAIQAGLTRHRGNNTILVVTSSVPAEGKTDLVRDLAQTLATLDQRVLTIENVVRRQPVYAWDSQDMAEAETCHQTALTMQMHSAGSKIASYYRTSTDLRSVFESHDRLQGWLETNGAHFDVVIVEAPPILTNADALILTRLADLVMLVVKWNATPKAAVANAYAQLNGSKAEIGIVLNQVDLIRHKALGLKDNLYFHRRYLEKRETRQRSAAHPETA